MVTKGEQESSSIFLLVDTTLTYPFWPGGSKSKNVIFWNRDIDVSKDFAIVRKSFRTRLILKELQKPHVVDEV